MHQENPLYEEQELRMEMFEPSDDETEGNVINSMYLYMDDYM